MTSAEAVDFYRPLPASQEELALVSSKIKYWFPYSKLGQANFKTKIGRESNYSLKN